MQLCMAHALWKAGGIAVYVGGSLFVCVVKAGDLSLDTTLPHLLQVEQQDIVTLQEEMIPI